MADSTPLACLLSGYYECRRRPPYLKNLYLSSMNWDSTRYTAEVRSVAIGVRVRVVHTYQGSRL
ncbi:9653_t:CDS:2, partial [Acaulospora colombiana]